MKLRLFLDTANIVDIQQANELGVIDGVTTNPTLIAKEGVIFKDRIAEICQIIKGSVSAEVLATDYEGMVKEALDLANIAPNVTIKLPMTTEGLRAVKTLSEKGISTNVTLIFSANQALLAARAGATYVSPFVGRLEDVGQSGMELVRDIHEIFTKHQIQTKIIAASIRTPEHVHLAALAGANIATVPYPVILQMTKHPLTDQGIEQFLSDWKKAKKDA